MKAPFTRQTLKEWGGPSMFRDGSTLSQRGRITDLKLEGDILSATVTWGSRCVHTKARILKDHSCENLCPCRDSVERGIVCTHVIAAALAYLERTTDPELARKMQEEERHAQRMRRGESTIFFRRYPAGTPGAVPCHPRLELEKGWRSAAESGEGVPVAIYLEDASHRLPIASLSPATPLTMGERDENVLFTLEEIIAGPIPSHAKLPTDDFIQLLALCGERGVLDGETGATLRVENRKAETALAVRMDAEGPLKLRLRAKDEAEGEKEAGEGGEAPKANGVGVQGDAGDEEQVFWAGKSRVGWVFTKGSFRPLKQLLPLPMREIYRHPMSIPREKVPVFLKKELPIFQSLIAVELENFQPDDFAFIPGTPSFALLMRGSPASLSFRLGVRYSADGPDLIAGRETEAGSFTIPDADDIFHYRVRNLRAEQDAILRLARYGISGPHGEKLTPLVGMREVQNFLGRAVPVLRRLGWRIEWEGRISSTVEAAQFVTPVVKIQPNAVGGWFDVQFDYDDGEGGSVSMAEIERALARGDAFIERKGRTLLLDADAISTLRDIFKDCSSRDGSAPGSFRLSSVYAAYTASTLRGLDGVDIEAPPAWLDINSGKSGELAKDDSPWPDPSLETTLRPYQKDGVRWLRALQKNGFSGILADEMGLGKTLQTLVWLEMLKEDRRAAGMERIPSLIVCPTSLVENWAAEAGRFTPSMKVGIVAGADRRGKLQRLGDYDIVLTSYALVRRDIETYAKVPFAAAVLDEAQHIKNQSTQNARAAKRICADHRLVLTGTPIENSVSDLWSIMDFLMPGYLGNHAAFKANVETPILEGGEEGEQAQWKLRHKLSPFLLRRLKRDVAKELPPKIERIAYCALTADQKAVYSALLADSRRRLQELVDEKGFKRSRFEILNTLLRLRQVCCHTGLLKLEGVAPKAPSAKMDLFFELLDEAMDAGHRILVFSQFVSMLKILQKELDARKLSYCYLDGATQNRLDIVRKFNQDASIPVFLISLKAGGTGLNLTGADMVVHFDPWWNPAVENQATDRAYRIGQRRTVYSVKLITKDTVEERVVALQQRKQKLYDATLAAGGGLDELAGLTWEDVKEILAD